MKIRHILLPSDLSEEGMRPFSAIAEFAADQGARITLLHLVHDLKVIPHGAPLAPKQSSPELAQEMEHAREELEKQRAALPAELSVAIEVGAAESIPEGLTRWADEHDVDLIALSTHGRTGFRHLALGSIAESLLHHSHIPVLCFPRRE